MRTIEKILDQARWAPSGDNTQPWRFEVVDDMTAVIHGFDTRNNCVYDLEGHASWLAHGILLETLSIAATTLGCRSETSVLPPLENGRHQRYGVRLVPDSASRLSPLAAHIGTRTVQRRPLSTRPIEATTIRALEEAARPLKVKWFLTAGERWKIARLNFRNAEVRLTIREAYEVHKRVIEWGTRFSDDRIPEAAVGIDPLTARLMKWVMKDWDRVRFFNRWLAGTLAPRIQLDLLPGLLCGAHACLQSDHDLESAAQNVEAGRAVARFWLTCAAHDVQLQPEMTPLIFSRYVLRGIDFTTDRSARELARRNADHLIGKCGIDPMRSAWLCRVGHGAQADARSLRLGLHTLREHAAAHRQKL